MLKLVTPPQKLAVTRKEVENYLHLIPSVTTTQALGTNPIDLTGSQANIISSNPITVQHSNDAATWTNWKVDLTGSVSYTGNQQYIKATLDNTGAVVFLTSIGEAQDQYLDSLITAAQAWAEGYIGRVFGIQTWMYTLDSWPSTPTENPWSYLPIHDLHSITKIEFITADGTRRTLDPSIFQVTSDYYPRLGLAANQSWPVADLQRMNPIEITFTCGIETPSELQKVALCEWILARWNGVEDVPKTVTRLLDKDRVIPI